MVSPGVVIVPSVDVSCLEESSDVVEDPISVVASVDASVVVSSPLVDSVGEAVVDEISSVEDMEVPPSEVESSEAD